MFISIDKYPRSPLPFAILPVCGQDYELTGEFMWVCKLQPNNKYVCVFNYAGMGWAIALALPINCTKYLIPLFID